MLAESVTLVESQPGNRLSVGYQVHIKIVLDKETELQVQNIAKKLNLELKKERDKIIIYKPK